MHQMSEKTKSFPKWVNIELSKKYAYLIPKGESQTIEFKKEIDRPEKISKEIAAFATSNEGTILIGVDDGQRHSVIGIPGGMNFGVRSKLVQKLEGICSGSVKPPVTPKFEFLIIENKVVLALIIPQGPEPLYYNTNNVPYVRNHTQSRPAEPSAVYKIFEQYFTDAQDPEENIFSDLNNGIRDIFKILDQTEFRQIRKWSDIWKSDLGYIANSFRDISISDIAEKYSFNNDLKQLSGTLDALSNLRESTMVGPKELINQLRIEATSFNCSYLNDTQLNNEEYNQVFDVINQSHKKLKMLIDRSDELLYQGRYDYIIEEASEIGKNLLTICYFDINSKLNGKQEELKKIAINLDLVETARLHSAMDHCLKEIIKKLNQYQLDLEQIVSQISYIK